MVVQQCEYLMPWNWRVKKWLRWYILCYAYFIIIKKEVKTNLVIASDIVTIKEIEN